jgi:hypothetical protein
MATSAAGAAAESPTVLDAYSATADGVGAIGGLGVAAAGAGYAGLFFAGMGGIGDLIFAGGGGWGSGVPGLSNGASIAQAEINGVPD